MKRDESRELLSARRLLSEFESDMTAPEAENRLSEALSLLSDITEGGGAEAQIAENIVSVYASKTVAAVDATLAKSGEASADELRLWKELLAEFGRCGFESPITVEAMSRLSKRLATRYVSKLTRGEKAALLKKLEEDLGKGR